MGLALESYYYEVVIQLNMTAVVLLELTVEFNGCGL